MGRNHRLRRLAALATCVGNAAVVAAFGIAAPAMAAEKVTCYPTGFASGSSLQGSAQTEDWLTSGTEGWGGTDFEASEKTQCTEKPEAGSGPKITYTKTSSGEGLEEFGDNSGVFKPDFDPKALEAGKKSEIPLVANAEPEEGSGKVEAAGLDFYVTTDDAPSNSQDGEAEAAAEAHNPAQITIPVAQAPIAVMLSLPAGCEVEPGSEADLGNATLSELWDGAIPAQGGYAANTWGALLVQLGYTKIAHASEFEEGAEPKQYVETRGAKEKVLRLNGKGETVEVEEEEPGCVQAISLQADYTESGTSYPFKTYLSQIDYTVWNAYADDAENWPSTVKLEDPNTSGSGSRKSESDGGLAENTAANPGSVGYASVGDAAKNGGFSAAATISQFGTGLVKEGGKEVAAKSLKHEILWAEIQNNGTAPASEATYTPPLISGGGHAANCATSVLVPGDESFPSSYNDSWYGITTTDPNIKGDASNAYSICALTFDVTWHHFQNPGLFGKHKTSEEVANTAHNLMEYITTQGQLDVQSHYYQRFPTAMAAHIAIAVQEIKY